MNDSNQIPGFSEMSDWPALPTLPLTLKSHGSYRDPKPHCTHYVELTDADGRVYSFFFDRFLGRLCYGSTDETATDAAFVTSGSQVAKDVFAVLMDALQNDEVNDLDRLQDVVVRGLRWAE